MSQTTISSNGHGTAPHGTAAPAKTAPERRQVLTHEAVSPEAVSAEAVSPETLIERHVEGARLQLAEARERLKAARRRVVQLEDALCNWERFAAELRRERGNGSK